MHAALLPALPVLAAAKSRVPFYIAGGLLVCWALFLSLGLGLRKPEFPGSVAAERTVIGITLALVVATMAMAVATSGAPG
jgi:arginine exporter protein ArgO